MLYTTFEDLLNHTIDNDLAYGLEELIRDLKNPYAYCDKDFVYGLSMAFLMGMLEEPQGRKYSGIYEYSSALLECLDKEEAVNLANNVMHVLHLQDPAMREEGTKSFISNFYEDGMYFMDKGYEGIHLTWKSPVPQQFVDEISNAVSPYGYCSIQMNCAYSHFECGCNYDYSHNESINITIFCDSEQGLEMAVKAVKALHLVYKGA